MPNLLRAKILDPHVPVEWREVLVDLKEFVRLEVAHRHVERSVEVTRTMAHLHNRAKKFSPKLCFS